MNELYPVIETYLAQQLIENYSRPVINSLSGGKTSSYIAANYPADINIFAIVCIDDHNAGKRIDKKMKQMVNDRLAKTSSQWGEFKATSEDPKILKVIFDLEQMIGSEITWVRGVGWEELLRQKKFLPNIMARYCTTELKIRPIFTYLYYRGLLPCKMRIGYRSDEADRVLNYNTTFKFTNRSQYREGAGDWINRWEEFIWNIPEFPLIEDSIWEADVLEYWKDKDIDFPIDSNCLNCFWKQEQQLRRNFDAYPEIMMSSAIQEDIVGGTFKKKMSLLEIQKLGLQTQLFESGAGCQAGFCTN